MNNPISRRSFLAASALCACGCMQSRPGPAPAPTTQEPIIDIHQHTNYSARSDESLLAHQRHMGIAMTVLLPAGHPMALPSTHQGKSNGLAAECGPNETCYRIVREHPDHYRMFANEVPDAPGAKKEIETYLKLGALGIGEQKFNIDVESPPFDLVASIAREFAVPVLIHFQAGMYNHGFDRFHRVLERFPTVNFIAHAQTTWANIDKAYVNDPKNLYPKTPVTPGGLTDRYLYAYPNFFADISAGSGLNALNRDPAHARMFLERHQDKILYGSDCNDHTGFAPLCQGALTIAAIKRLASPAVQSKIFHANAQRLLRLPRV
jgi:predicted TIM-barrel fold metal-dependent hydrolase